MGRLIDLTGQKFGQLTVTKRMSNKKKHPMWLCRCDCGKEKIIDGQSLRNGDTKSCGCLSRKITSARTRLPLGVASMRGLFWSYKRHAKNRGLGFELTEKEFSEITQKNCYYCGTKPNGIVKENRRFGNYIYNGIDRIDNTKGYTINNIVSCCKICNFAKRDLTVKVFKDWIERIHNNMFRKEDQV